MTAMTLQEKYNAICLEYAEAFMRKHGFFDEETARIRDEIMKLWDVEFSEQPEKENQLREPKQSIRQKIEDWIVFTFDGK